MKKSYLIFLSFFLTMGLLSACVSMDHKPASSKLDLRAKNLKPSRGRALVYIVRPGFIGKPFARDIFVDGKKVGSNCGGQYIYFISKPGTRTLKTKGDNTAELKIKFKSGKIYFIEQTVSPGLMKGIMGFKQLSQSEGKKKLNECQLSSVCSAI